MKNNRLQMSRLMHRTVIVPVLLFLLAYLCQYCIAAAKCSHTQVEICIDNDFTFCLCVNCMKCPSGEGLQPQCSSRVVMQVPKCVKCKEGVTYSDNDDIGSCIPCHICEGTDMLQPCNSTHNTICSKDCAKGFKRSPVTELCEKDITDDIWKKINLTKRSEDIVNKTSTQHSKTSPSATATVIQHHKSQSKDLFPIYIGCALGLAIVLVIAWVVREYKHLFANMCTFVTNCLRNITTASSKTVPRMASLGDETLALTVPDLLLNSISPDLERSISAAISKPSIVVKGWRDIGHEYGVTRHDLDLMEMAYRSNNSTPGQELLRKIDTIKPNETLENFIKILVKMKRFDVIDLIKKEYSQ